jgi:hypothetical protein
VNVTAPEQHCSDVIEYMWSFDGTLAPTVGHKIQNVFQELRSYVAAPRAKKTPSFPSKRSPPPHAARATTPSAGPRPE